MPAALLDGVATARAIRDELRPEIASLAELRAVVGDSYDVRPFEPKPAQLALWQEARHRFAALSRPHNVKDVGIASRKKGTATAAK